MMRLCYSLLACLMVGVGAAQELRLEEVLDSVKQQYPPYLAVLIEQDLRNGRARQAMGAFDARLLANSVLTPLGYYSGSSNFAGVEQPLMNWGGGIYGGYRFSGNDLPDYDKSRTQEAGNAVIGFRVPLLRDGVIDGRRAALFRARIDQELADPIILRQYLDFIRSGTVAYFNWLAAGYRVNLAQDLLRNAEDRQEAVVEMVEKGAQAPVVRVDNERLVVSRKLGLVSARRRLEMAELELSLFHRDAADQPIRVGVERLPKAFPPLRPPSEDEQREAVAKAKLFRPEIRRLELLLERNEVEKRLAKNQLLPNLDLAVELNQGLGERTQKDMDQTELQARVQLAVPLQRREAKGAVEVALAQERQLETELQFARDQITQSVSDALSAVKAALDQ
jgi:outer membrane protein TolC